MLSRFPLVRSARIACAFACVCVPVVSLADSFTQANLVSDVPGLANTTDPNLKNPWGVSFSSTGPFWISNQLFGTSTLYTGTGAVIPLVVSIPGAHRR